MRTFFLLLMIIFSSTFHALGQGLDISQFLANKEAGMGGGVPENNPYQGNVAQGNNAQRNYPQGYGGGPANRDELAILDTVIKKDQCPFIDKATQEESTLLANARSAISSLNNENACPSIAPQAAAFETAMTTYTRANGTSEYNAPGNVESNNTVNCANYNEIYDSGYEFFVNNFNPEFRPTDHSNPFNTRCGREATEEAAITCAARFVGQLKNEKRQSCASFRNSHELYAQAHARNEALTTAMTALSGILSNPTCLDATGAQRSSLIQTATSLVGRIGSAAVGGTIWGPLIAAGADLFGSALQGLLGNGRRDLLENMQGRDDFNRLACLYEQLDEKDLRCDSIRARRELRGLDSSRQECSLIETQAGISGLSPFLTHMNSLTSAMNPPPPSDESSSRDAAPAAPAAPPAPANLGREGLMSLLNTLEPIYSTNPDFLAESTQKAQQTKDRLTEILHPSDNFQALKTFLESQGVTSITPNTLRQYHQRLSSEMEVAGSVQSVLSVLDQAYSDIAMSPSTINSVQRALDGFEGGPLNFARSFNQTMIRGAFLDPASNLGDRVLSAGLRIDQPNIQSSLIERIEHLENVSENPSRDSGSFRDTKGALLPHLRRMAYAELDDRLKDAQDALGTLPSGPPALNSRDRWFEQNINPMIRACGQLRGVLNSRLDRGQQEAQRDLSKDHAACQIFNCPERGGNDTFSNFLSQNANLPQATIDNSCRGVCDNNYAEFVCHERKRLPSVVDKFKDEFFTQGKICGRDIAAALGGRR